MNLPRLTTRGGVSLLLLLAACSPPPQDPAFTAELAKFDTEYAQARAELPQQLRGLTPLTFEDFRGRLVAEDVAQWVFPPASVARIDAVRHEAGALRGAAATASLDQARLLLRVETARASDLSGYWMNQLPAPYWRRYWQAFFDANGIHPPAPDTRLVEIESQLRAALDAGNFAQANAQAPSLNRALRESLLTANRSVVDQRKEVALQFTPRKGACGAPRSPVAGTQKAKYAGGESIESFYPRSAMERGEEGAVVLRLQISRAGCATAAAVAVHSASPSLDAAALQWFEAAQFTPASRAGRAVASELTLKVLFKIEG